MTEQERKESRCEAVRKYNASVKGKAAQKRYRACRRDRDAAAAAAGFKWVGKNKDIRQPVNWRPSAESK